MKFTTTHKKIVLFSVLVVLLIAGHYLLYRFVDSSDVAVSRLQAETEMVRTQASEFSKYSSEDLRTLAEGVSSHFISKTDIVGFLERLEKQARAERVAITINSVDVEPHSEDENDDKERVRLRFETLGTWTNTMDFVSYIEHLPYAAAVTSLGLTQVVNDTTSSSTARQWKGLFEFTALKFK